MKLNSEDVSKLDKYYRINLINQMTGPKSVNLVGTVDGDGRENLAIFNSVVHVGANPAAVGLMFRPLTVPRHSYTNIKESQCFTLNSVTSTMINAAHHCSAKYDKGESEFDKSGLTSIYFRDFPAPFVSQSPVKMGCRYVEEYKIAFNGTIFMVAELIYLDIAEEWVDEKGHILHEEMKTATVAGLDSYYENNLIQRLEFARPK